MANARKIAVNALIKVDFNNAYSNITLNELLKNSNASVADKALATALFYGVLDRKITLDYVLNRLIEKGFKKLDSFTLNVLRVGLYQLMFTEKIPQSAAVNESVKIIKASKYSRNAGFVNAVLRNYIRQNIELPNGNSVKDLSIKFSCPEWIINDLLTDYSVNTVINILEEFLTAPELYLRVNRAKNSADELVEILKTYEIKSQKINEYTVLITDGGFNFEKFEPYLQGRFFVQDLSSQRCANAVNPKTNERILDMCAAPGGKTFAMADLMEGTGEIVSCDIHPHKIELIKSGAKRLGFNNISPFICDATQYNENLGKFNVVLCDVPCSGFGIIKRKPDIKYKNENNFKDLQDIQLKILENAVNYLFEKGRIIYSTCTIRKSENEAIINKFLTKYQQFSLQEMNVNLPKKNNGDGFFTAVLIKK